MTPASAGLDTVQREVSQCSNGSHAQTHLLEKVAIMPLLQPALMWTLHLSDRPLSQGARWRCNHTSEQFAGWLRSLHAALSTSQTLCNFLTQALNTGSSLAAMPKDVCTGTPECQHLQGLHLKSAACLARPLCPHDRIAC